MHDIVLRTINAIGKFVSSCMPTEVVVNENVHIPLTELQFQFARSSGKGGQNVNKVETKVELSFNLRNSRCFTDAQRSLLQERLSTRLDTKGVLHIVVQESRSQWRNRELAIVRLVEVLRTALKPKRKRIRTKVPAASKEKRLMEKKRRREVIRSRRIDE